MKTNTPRWRGPTNSASAGGEENMIIRTSCRVDEIHPRDAAKMYTLFERAFNGVVARMALLQALPTRGSRHHWR